MGRSPRIRSHGKHRDRRLPGLAAEIDGIYASDEKAPAGWHRKEQLKKELRQEVRYLAHGAGFGTSAVREVAGRVEDYALRHYVKVG